MNTKSKTANRRRYANITATDVARRAGVSPMTVSRVVNGEVSVRESTRAAVDEAIRELGYLPNKAARSLASSQEIKVGLLYSNPSSTYLSAMLLGVLEQARQSDTHVVVVSCDGLSDTNEVINGLLADAVDGLILAPPLCDSQQAFDIITEKDIPAVTLGSRHEQENISAVYIDDIGAAHALTEHLVALGHRRIGFIIGHPRQSASSLRLQGFRNAMRQAGIEVDDELIVQGKFSYQSGFESADNLLKLKNKPTAIIGSNDDMAAGVIASAYHHHINVPEDLTVCGFDDTMLATTVWPSITTMRQPIADMSRAAIEILERNVRRKQSGQELQAQRLQLDFSLVQRQSDAPPGNKGPWRSSR